MKKVPLREDIFMRGIIAGVIAGLIKDIPSIIVHLSHSDVFPTYWDFSGMIGFGQVPNTFLNICLAIIVELGFSITIGIAVVYGISKIKSHHYLLEGGYFGAAVWFFIRASMWIFAVKEFNKPQMFAFVINLTTSIGYGLLIAYIDKLLKNRQSR